MKIVEMVNSLDRDFVLEALFRFYPDEEKNIKGYKEAWDELKETELISTEGRVIIGYTGENTFNEKEFEPWYDVYGEYPDAEYSYALEFNPWGEWLSMEVEKGEDCPVLTDIELMAHSLYEITWCGYSNKEVKDNSNEILDSCEEARKEIKEIKDLNKL